MSDKQVRPAPDPAAQNRLGPPTKHQLALMICIAVFPTLTILNLALDPWFSDTGAVMRTFVLASVAVPIVIHGLMPRLHRIRVRLVARRAF